MLFFNKIDRISEKGRWTRRSGIFFSSANFRSPVSFERRRNDWKVSATPFSCRSRSVRTRWIPEWRVQEKRSPVLYDQTEEESDFDVFLVTGLRNVQVPLPPCANRQVLPSALVYVHLCTVLARVPLSLVTSSRVESNRGKRLARFVLTPASPRRTTVDSNLATIETKGTGTCDH